MKLFLSACFVFIYQFLSAQPLKKAVEYEEEGKYISFNFLSLVEPQFAIGPSAGWRFTERSEFFVEAAYVVQSPFHDNTEYSKLRGSRLLVEYRYHFLGTRKRIFPLLPFRSNGRKLESFIGIQGMLKPVKFNAKATFINPVLNDTLSNYSFNANANTAALAVTWGSVINLSSNEKWKLEISIGIGGKDRKVKLKSIPDGYKRPADIGLREWLYIPPLYENTGGLHIPFGLRLRYLLD
jgi:hypothetical protein